MPELTRSATGMAEGLLAALPRLAVGLVVLVAGWAAIGLAVRLAAPAAHHPPGPQLRPGLRRPEPREHSWSLTLAVAAVIFPSVNPGSLLAGLGVLSIAASFAFQDILQTSWPARCC